MGLSATAALATVLQLSLGASHTCVLLEGRELKCFGLNDAGQLGYGDTENRGDGPGEMGHDLLPLAFGGMARVRSVATGGKHTCAILSDDSLRCWGDNAFGQLGLGDTQRRGVSPETAVATLPAVDLGAGRRAISLALGERHSCAVLDDGALKCWGRNANGELGQGDLLARGVAPGQMGDALPGIALGSGLTARSAAAGSRHTCAILSDASVRCWGDGALGQLGNGAAAVVGDDPSDLGDALVAVDLGAGNQPKTLIAGFVHTCVRLQNDALKCFGYNRDGRLGLGDLVTRGSDPAGMGEALPALSLAPGQNLRAAACGYRHCCAVFDARTIKCFGIGGANGSLGLEDQASRGGDAGEMGDDLPFLNFGDLAAATSVSLGESHGCALFLDGGLRCWGANRYGQLGLGDTQPRGAAPQTMGRFLPSVAL